MTANGIDASSTNKRVIKAQENQGLVNIEALAGLVGFPSDFIKKELLVSGEDISMDDLREKMVSYLRATDEKMKQ